LSTDKFSTLTVCETANRIAESVRRTAAPVRRLTGFFVIFSQMKPVVYTNTLLTIGVILLGLIADDYCQGPSNS
jgi:hypothetical protein